MEVAANLSMCQEQEDSTSLGCLVSQGLFSGGAVMGSLILCQTVSPQSGGSWRGQ